jgi:alpha-beta hydrolase superfamily lysophospholipase
MAQSPGNTLREETIKGSSGLNIFVRSWRPDEQPRGVVVIVPGFNSHSGHYLWVGDQLAVRGIAVYSLDLRGRGRSDGDRFYVQEFSDYINDVSR